MGLIRKIYGKLRMCLYKHKVRKLVILERNTVINSGTTFEGHNRVAENSRVINCSVGFGTIIAKNADLCNVEIGKYSLIGDVEVIRGQHPVDFVSLHPAFYSIAKQAGFTYVDKQYFDEYRFVDDEKTLSAKIGNDVWITKGCKIIEGVTIGDGAVILPGAVVNKDIPPYAVAGGVPAKVIRYRFDENTIAWLKELCWWDKDEDWLISHASHFSDPKKLRQVIETEESKTTD